MGKYKEQVCVEKTHQYLSGLECTLQRLLCTHGHVCRVEAMQQGTEGTERFCIKQLLKPIDNVGCHELMHPSRVK